MVDPVKQRSRQIDSRDELYVRTWFVDLELLARIHNWGLPDLLRAIDELRAPAPSYILESGARMVPADYFALIGGPDELESLRERFDTRLVKAAEPGRLSDQERDEAWAGYISGGFGVCLKDLSPESIVAKSRFVRLIEQLLDRPCEGDAEWIGQLRAAVDGLDSLEKPFAAFDREYYGGPVTRDRFITAVRLRFLSE